MPALNPVPNVVKVALKGASSAADQDIVNIFHLAFTGASPTPLQLNALAGFVTAAWTADLAGLFKSTFQLTKVTIEDLTSSTAAVGEDDTGSVGSRAGAELSAGAAVCISKHIARRYRGGHPRSYLMALTQPDLETTSTWLPTPADDCRLGWIAFITNILTHPWAGGTLTGEVNVSYFLGFTNHTFPSGRVRPIPNPRATPLVDPIIGYRTNPHVASQRRRNQQSV